MPTNKNVEFGTKIEIWISHCELLSVMDGLMSICRRLVEKLIQVVTPAVKNKGLNSAQRISPIVFYGSPHGVPPKRPVRLLRLLHEIRLDLTEQSKARYWRACILVSFVLH